LKEQLVCEIKLLQKNRLARANQKSDESAS